ncbi:MAG TPA: ABC transporter permease [Candidatus Nanoarchaeia archaeon]|nr:ABC transporter permease [Candidatus Nanoarchaeia archaeon]
MNIYEVKYALQNFRKRKLRSGLTILSILIGITAIFALLSFGIGIQRYVDTVADEAGRDKLFVQAKGIGAPGTDENFFLSKDDVDFVSKIKGVDEIVGMYFKAGEIKLDDQKKFYYVMGVDTSNLNFIEESFAVDVISGRRLKKGDIGKAVLGYNYQLKDKIFKNPVRLGDKIEINSKKFEVVGFHGEIGNPQDDANVFVTKEAFEIMYPESKNKFGFIMISAQKGVIPSDLAISIETRLRKHKNQDEGKEDFFVQTFEDALATFTTIINVINGMLLLIALVSLVVAFVNIMNTMYTAIIERTKEIGVMKAIGAKNSDILIIFVVEAGLIGLIGGLLGVFLGYIISSIGGSIAAASGFALLKPAYPISLIIGCLFFSLLVGTAAGFFPARRASKLKPVDALRYE